MVEEVEVKVMVPNYLVDYVKTHHRKTYNIACVDRHSTFVLVEIEGMISYPEVYNEFTLNGSISKRMAKKEEEKLFLFSRFANVWFAVFLICFPMLFLMFFEEPGFFLFMTPFLLPMVIFTYLSYKKRKKYMENRLVLHRIKGTLNYDKELSVYYIDDVKLKLPFGWHKYLKENFSILDKIEIEAFLHTFDTLDEKITRSLQPISVQSHNMRIDHKEVPIVRSIWMPLLAFAFTATMVFGMHSDSFIPYTYHAFNTASCKSDFYSSEGFRQSKIKEQQYVETVGLALPILRKKDSDFFGYATVETDENYIYFPKDITQSILNYPKVPKEFAEVMQRYRKIKFDIETLKLCNDYKNNQSYMRYCIRSALSDLRTPYEVFEPFETYKPFLEETTPETFKALTDELFTYYKSKLYAFYEKLEPLEKEGVSYRRYPQNSNYSPTGFYENMEYLNYMFGYLDTFPKTETLAGIVNDVESKIWHVREDNYNYVFYTLFLTLFWFISLLLMLYVFWVLSIRVKSLLSLIFIKGKK